MKSKINYIIKNKYKI